MDPVEARIEAALRGLPGPTTQVTDGARAGAIAAAMNGRHRVPHGLLPAVAGAAAAIVAAVVVVGVLRHRTPPPAVADGRIDLVPGVGGVAVRVGDVAWVRTRTGFDIRGRRADAVDLSPNSRFVAIGRGRGLTALAPDGTARWRRSVTGPVVAVSWAPNPEPIHLAYVVRDGARFDLRTVEGDGDNDRLVTRDVTADRPTWNRQPLQIWFQRPDGTAWTADPADARVIGQTKPPYPDPASDAAVGRALAASGHGDWVRRAVEQTGTGALVGISPPGGDGARGADPIELWWVPVDRGAPPRTLGRLTGPRDAHVEIAARS